MRIQIVMSLVGKLLYIFGAFLLYHLYIVFYLKLHIGPFVLRLYYPYCSVVY